MNPIIFKSDGVLPDQKHLPGQYSWSYPVKLSRAWLKCTPPTAQVLVLMLEVGGVDTGIVMTVPGGSSPTVSLERVVNLLVPANTEVRWRAIFAGLPEEAATGLALTMGAVPQGVSAKRAALTVQWVKGRETLTLFSYDAETHVFSLADASGLAASRASITDSGGGVLSIKMWVAGVEVEVLRVAGGVVYAPEWIAMGGLTDEILKARLIFKINDVAVAQLNAVGFRVVELTEDDPAVLTPSAPGFYGRFEFYSGGVLTGALSKTGFVGKDVREPL